MFLKASSLSINCPIKVYRNSAFSCDLTVISGGRNYSIDIDFGDGTIMSAFARDSTIKINKDGYGSSGIFVLQVNVASNSLSVNPYINGTF